jgi:GAF domain-containing protein
MESTDPFDLTLLLAAILHRALKWVGTPHGYLCLLSQTGNTMEVAYATGLAEIHVGSTISRGAGVVGLTWENGNVQVVSSYAKWSDRLPDPRRLDAPQVSSVMGVPLSINDEVIGVMGLFIMDPTRTFTRREIQFFSDLGTTAATLLDRATHTPSDPIASYVATFYESVPHPPSSDIETKSIP